MNKNIIPKNFSTDMKEKHGKSESWSNFARRSQKNPFVKSYILNRDSNKCQWCNWSIDNKFHVHHIDYDHTCEFGEMTKYDNPTLKRPNRVIKVPDCERCSKECPLLFNDCMSRLTVVHAMCNFKIENHH